MSEEKKKKKKELPTRNDWLIADQQITQAMRDLLIKGKGKIPTIEQIAEKAGCSRRTVERHLNLLSIQDRFKSFRALTGDVIIALYKAAATGDPKAIDGWMKYVENFRENPKLEITQLQIPNVLIPGDEEQ